MNKVLKFSRIEKGMTQKQLAAYVGVTGKYISKGHVGVVAKSFDINFDSKNDDGKPISSDVLVKEVGESWDKSFVMIFPMTSDILGNRSVGDLELGIGNYLIEKNVPIIDFYSHNN